MKHLSTTIAVYDDVAAAEGDWAEVEKYAGLGVLDLADAALVTRHDDAITPLKRQSHRGWGKGAVAGAVVGILFPPAVLGSAVVGAAGGGIVATLNRSLDRHDLREMGEVMSQGTIAMVVLTSTDTAGALAGILKQATRSLTKASATAEDVMASLETDTSSE
jgi:uncharacterized membrane protein